MFGVPIGLHYSWFIIALLITLSLAAAQALHFYWARETASAAERASLLPGRCERHAGKTHHPAGGQSRRACGGLTQLFMTQWSQLSGSRRLNRR